MEVIIMKKTTVERLIAKLENISLCIVDELSFIKYHGHSSGMYTIDDLERITFFANSAIKSAQSIKDSNKYAFGQIQYLSAGLYALVQQLTEILNNEEV